MQLKIQTMPGLILIILLTAIPILSQETPKTSFVKDSAPTKVVSSGEKRTTAAADECEQRLLKTLDALEKAESLTRTLETEINARKRLETVNNEILEVKDRVISEQKKLIEILGRKTGRKFSVLWGIISVRF